MNAEELIANFETRGIRLIPNAPRLTVEPASKLTDADRALIRVCKDELLAALTREREQAEIVDCSAPGHIEYLLRASQSCTCLPGDLYGRARAISRHCEQRGIDLKAFFDEHPAALSAPAVANVPGWTCAHSIVATCHAFGVALRIDPETGDLVVGKAGAKADEPSQPWPSLLVAIEAHLPAVAELGAAGWTLRACFPQGGTA